jgi:O-antigen/teichoic acid export membrane protein
MAIKSYLFVATFYMLSGFGIYLLMSRALSHSPERKTKIVKFLSLAISSVLTFGGIGFITFMFFYLHK